MLNDCLTQPSSSLSAYFILQLLTDLTPFFMPSLKGVKWSNVKGTLEFYYRISPNLVKDTNLCGNFNMDCFEPQ